MFSINTTNILYILLAWTIISQGGPVLLSIANGSPDLLLIVRIILNILGIRLLYCLHKYHRFYASPNIRNSFKLYFPQNLETIGMLYIVSDMSLKYSRLGIAESAPLAWTSTALLFAMLTTPCFTLITYRFSRTSTYLKIIK